MTKTLNKNHRVNIIQDCDYSSEFTSLFFELNRDVEIHDSKPIPVCKNEMISSTHDSLFVGHYAYDKTLQKIRKQYKLPNITRDVKRYNELCQRQKDTKRQTCIPQATDIPTKPTDKISLDIIGPLDEIVRKNKSILVIEDYLTRYTMCAPLAVWASWL